MTASEAHQLKELEEGNARMKKVVANQALEIDAIDEVMSKNS